MSSVANVEIEQENFIELGIYLYRSTPAILELQESQNCMMDAVDLLQYFSCNVNIANELVKKCYKGKQSIPKNELKKIIPELKEVISNIGDELSSVASRFKNQQYVNIAVDSLSREMKNVSFCEGKDEEEKEEESNPTLDSSSKNPVLDFSSTFRNDMPRLKDFLKGMHYGAHGKSSKTLPQLSEQFEPLYDTFFCPLTKKMMDDPVTIESGITYERRAITECFGRHNGDCETTICPVTGMEIKSRRLNTNIALKTIIAEWKERNEATRIRVAQTALTLARSDTTLLDAIRDLRLLCRNRSHNKVKMHDVGITELLTGFLEYKDTKVRCETMKLLCILAEDEEGKEIITKTKSITTSIKLLSSHHSSVRHAAVSLLLELSKSHCSCESIGSVTGSIQMLIATKNNHHSDPLASDKAGEILNNLEACRKNIKCMAQNGHLEPLLNHLIDGSEEMQVEMVKYLNEIVIGDNMKTYVATKASMPLIQMFQSGDIITRKLASKALVNISSHQSNNQILVDAHVVSVMIKELFRQTNCDSSMDSREQSSAILANILESGINPNTLEIEHGYSMASDYVINNILHMLKYSTPNELRGNLVKILLSLTNLPKSFATIISMIKEGGTSLTIIEFLNSTHDELVIASAELLIKISSHMGHAIIEGLCRTRGQLEGLISNFEHAFISKKHAISANLLAKLPHQNLNLNLYLLQRGMVTTVLQRVHEIQTGRMRTSRHMTDYLEGLVGILARFTATLYDQDIFNMVREQNLVSVFTGMLTRTVGSDEVQRLSAVGLERLSLEYINISRRLLVSGRRNSMFLGCCRLGSKKKRKTKVCPVHRRECSKYTDFCLVEANTVEKLLDCLEHQNGEVVEAALASLSTLLDERLDMEGSIKLLDGMNFVQLVLMVMREHKSEGVWHKCLWVVEKFLEGGGDRSTSYISSDSELPTALLNTLHQGDSTMRKVAENILRKLNQLPNFSSSFIL